MPSAIGPNYRRLTGVGAIGGTLSFVLMFYHLYTAERGTFYAVVLIAAAVFTVELPKFEREIIEKEIPYVNRTSERG